MTQSNDPTATFAEMRRTMARATLAVETDGGREDAGDGRPGPDSTERQQP